MLRKSLLIDATVYCHFCGEEVVRESTGKDQHDAWERTEKERLLGAHYLCFTKNQMPK